MHEGRLDDLRLEAEELRAARQRLIAAADADRRRIEHELHDGVQQQTLRVYQDVALLALDLLARVIPGRIDAGPPFSVLFTLWLSITQAVGLASRPSTSRHCT